MLSKETIAKILITASMISTYATPVLAQEELFTSESCYERGDYSRIYNQDNVRKAIAQYSQDNNISNLLVAILEDARGNCACGVSCAIASINTGQEIGLERLQALGLNITQLDAQYAVTLSKDPDKARAMLLIQLINEDTREYVINTLKDYQIRTVQEMRAKGLDAQALIAESAVLGTVNDWVYFLMKPHAEDSAMTVNSGLSLLNTISAHKMSLLAKQ